MTSTSRVPELWEAAFVRCRACLQPKDAAQILQVTTYDQLLESLSKNQQEHKKRVISRILNRIEPFLLSLRSLSGIIDTFVSAKPDVAALMWGGIKLTLELALRVRGAIERVVPGMSYVAQVTPRFEAYTSVLPNAPRLTEALIRTYEAIVLFLVASIKFLRTGSIKILFKSVGRDFSAVLQESQAQIEQRSRLVDIEAYAANMELDQERHEEIKLLVEHIPTSSSKSVNLPCYIIPYLQNPNFFRRDRELQLCRSVLNDPAATTSSRYFALHGIAGVGKTSIALSLAYEARLHKPIVIWFTADSKEKLDKTYSRAAHELGLHEDNASTEQDRDAVRSWLEKTDQPWFIVYDNVDDAGLLDDYVPAGSSGSVLITSRDPESQHGLAKQGCKVRSFDKNEGRDFLLNLLPGVDVNNEAYVNSVSEITDQLGGLPLGLKQVAGFLRESGIGISDLSELLNDVEQNKQVFADTSGFAKLGYGHTLSTVWTISLSRLDSETLNILGLLSFLDPDGIPETIMKSIQKSRLDLPTLFPSGPNTVGHFKSVSLLVRYGLVDTNQTTKSMSVHRLIQTSTLHAMPYADRNGLFDAVISILRKNHPQSQANSDTLFNSWDTCAVYAPHVLRLQVLQKQWNLQTRYPEQLWEILFNCSWYLVETGSMKSAQSLAEHAESLCDPTTERGQVHLSYLYNTYGVVRLQHRDLESAENWFRMVYDIRKKYLGETNINTVAVRLNFVLVLLDQKRYHDAIEDLEPLRSLLSTMPDLPPRLASGVYDFLSVACFRLGRLDEAWEHIQQSIEMTRETVPPYSQGSGYYYFLQGNIRMGQGNLPDALRLHSMGLKVRKKVLGDHVQTAAACYRTGDLMDRTGKSGHAIDLLIESKRMYRTLGLKEDFGRSGEARSAWRISCIMAKLGRQDEADSYAKEAINLREALGFGLKESLEQKDFDDLISGLEQ